MEIPDLYSEEIGRLRKFRAKINSNAIYKEDLDDFSNDYEELLAQTKVITRISDRLQKKLNNASLQIKDQNEEIKFKNNELRETIGQLFRAQVGKRASTIMLTVALFLFIIEQILLEPIIEERVSIPYIGTGILAVLFFIIKLLESSLEKHFMNKKKKEILESDKN